MGSGQAQDTLGLFERETFSSMKVTKLASQQAYKMAGVGPGEIDVAELHDCFTIAEIMAYEDLGFCEPGKGGKLIEDGVTQIGGKIPTNTSGGLLISIFFLICKKQIKDQAAASLPPQNANQNRKFIEAIYDRL